jgi:hypothetical protein
MIGFIFHALAIPAEQKKKSHLLFPGMYAEVSKGLPAIPY